MKNSNFVFEEKKVGTNSLKVFAGRPTSVYQMFAKTVKEYPDREAVKFNETVLTYAVLAARVNSLAAHLADTCTIHQGERVAIFLKNDDDFITAYLAISATGAVSVVLNTMLSPVELKYQIDVTKPACVIVDDTLWKSELDVLVAKTITKAELAEIYASNAETNFPPVVCKEEDVHTILFTSGTTGKPKGVQILHRNLIHSALRMAKYTDMLGVHPPEGKGIRTVIAAPLFHVMALQEQLLPVIYMSGTAVVVDKFNALSFLDIVEKEQTDRITGSPAMYRLISLHKHLKPHNLDCVRLVGFGGAPMPPDLIAEIQTIFRNAKLLNGFGLTEASVCTVNLGDECAQHPTSIGKASLGCEVKIVDLDLKEVGPSRIGEIMVKGPHVTGGYYNDPETTAKNYRDGCFLTGDLGSVDSQGYIYISGRNTEMINRGGENVYPVEIENVICLYPKVLEVAAFGVPDAVMGQKVAVVIVPVPGAQIEAEEIVNFCRDKLAKYKVPEYIDIMKMLPRNPNGKVIKKQLRLNLEAKLNS